ILNAAEADVVGAKRGTLGEAVGGADVTRIAPRAAAQEALGALRGAGGVLARALGVVAAVVPIGAPLPDIARHVEHAEEAGAVVGRGAVAQWPEATGSCESTPTTGCVGLLNLCSFQKSGSRCPVPARNRAYWALVTSVL